ncbi:metallophosphoesterase family protein [Fortiea contorta]|uniref:metallophosphoesterase family protein n=1 Tax=Fortiea contorta TaxID=1892405 RepID=UPI00036907BE|nr:metallophosphoesterase family protein [Fortiea contorta]
MSCIHGNYQALDAVLLDIDQEKAEKIFCLGDLVGPRKENPRGGELEPLICKGWWEEQCLILHGLGPTGDAPELMGRYGGDTAKMLWGCVSRQTVQWMRSLDFGFFELDCLLIHGTTVGVSEELTPATSPVQMLDRLSRMQANNLFCGRSGLAFQYQLQAGSLTTGLTTLDSQVSSQTVNISPRQVIGVGNVGRIFGEATYTLYTPATNGVEFRSVSYGASKGFQVNSSKSVSSPAKMQF